MYSLGIPVKNFKWKREAVSPQQNNRGKRHWLFGKWITPTGIENQQQDSGYDLPAPDLLSTGYDGNVNIPTIRHNDNIYVNKPASSNPSNYNKQVNNKFGLEISQDVIILIKKLIYLIKFIAEQSSVT